MGGQVINLDVVIGHLYDGHPLTVRWLLGVDAKMMAAIRVEAEAEAKKAQ